MSCAPVQLADEDIARQVAAVCGFVPLELRLVGGILSTGRRTAQDVIAIGRAAKIAAGLRTGDPFRPVLQLLKAWWEELVGCIFPGSELLMPAVLSVFAGSFGSQAARHVLAARHAAGQAPDAVVDAERADVADDLQAMVDLSVLDKLDSGEFAGS
jgi:hypothetical protein